MTTRRQFLLTVLMTVAMFVATKGNLSAGLILSFSPSSATVNANGSHLASVTIDVQAAADPESVTQTLVAYDLFVDLAPPSGEGIPAGWSVSAAEEVTNFDVFLNIGPASPGDVYASASQLDSPAINLTTTPVTLWRFDVNFDADAGAIDGLYDLSFVTSGNFGVADASDQDIPYSISPATITLQNLVATPEPSTLLLFSIAGIGWGSHRWLRRKTKHETERRQFS